MTDKALAIYCLLDDMFQIMGPKTDPHCKLNDAEIATTALMAALFFYGNQATACDYMQRHMGCHIIDKSGRFAVAIQPPITPLRKHPIAPV